MELITYIENYTKYEIPSFRHPMKVPQSLKQNMNSSNKPDQSNSDQYYSSGITIPDKIIFSPTVTPFVNDDGNQIQCYLLFGIDIVTQVIILN